MATSSRVPETPPQADAAQPRVPQELIQLLLAMSGRVLQHFAARAAQFELSPGEGKVLLTLQPGEALSMRALARRLHYDASNLTGLIDKLEDRGAIERRADPSDRRAKAIVPTDAGLRLREDFWRRLTTDVGPVRALTDAQRAELQSLLRTAVQDGQ